LSLRARNQSFGLSLAIPIAKAGAQSNRPFPSPVLGRRAVGDALLVATARDFWLHRLVIYRAMFAASPNLRHAVWMPSSSLSVHEIGGE
jgi:hypothetical protein